MPPLTAAVLDLWHHNPHFLAQCNFFVYLYRTCRALFYDYVVVVHGTRCANKIAKGDQIDNISIVQVGMIETKPAAWTRDILRTHKAHSQGHAPEFCGPAITKVLPKSKWVLDSRDGGL